MRVWCDGEFAVNLRRGVACGCYPSALGRVAHSEPRFEKTLNVQVRYCDGGGPALKYLDVPRHAPRRPTVRPWQGGASHISRIMVVSQVISNADSIDFEEEAAQILQQA